MAVVAGAMARAAITMVCRAVRRRNAFRTIASTAFVVATSARARATRAVPRKRGKDRMDRAGRLPATATPTTNAIRGNAMDRAHAIKPNSSPMVPHVRSIRNAFRGSASTVCAAIAHAQAIAWLVRRRKWGKAHRARAVSSPPALIRTRNAPMEHAMDPVRVRRCVQLPARRGVAVRRFVHHARLSSCSQRERQAYEARSYRLRLRNGQQPPTRTRQAPMSQALQPCRQAPRRSGSSAARMIPFAGRGGRPQGFQLGIPLPAHPRRIPYILLQTAMRTNSWHVTRTEDTGKGTSLRGVRRGLTVTSSSGWDPGIGGYFRAPFHRSSGLPRTGHCLLMLPELRS